MTTQTLFSKMLTLPLLTGCLIAGGCAMDDMDGNDPAGADDTLLLLSESQRPDSALERIASGFHVARPNELGLAKLADADQAQTRLSGVRGVAFSMADAGQSELEAWRPVVQAAKNSGIPLIISDAADSEQLASLIGIGFDADLLMVTPMGNSYRIDVYGDNSILEEHFAEDGIPDTLSPTPVQDLDRAVQEVSQNLLAHDPGQMFKSVTYYYYDINFSTYSWSLTSGQTATLNLDFEAELIADQLKAKKFVIFSQTGGGHHPGTLYTNGQYDRGYFQEAAKVSITPTTNGSNVDLYAHAPATSNNQSSYSSTTGWGIDATAGTDGASMTLSYDSSTTVTTTLDDFTAINNTSGTVASWSFQLNAVSGHSYDDWKDLFYMNLFERCKLYSLPNLAKSNLTPQFEAIYRADDSYSGTVTFQLVVKSLMRDTSATGDIFTCYQNTTLKTLTRTKNVSINFGQVSI